MKNRKIDVLLTDITLAKGLNGFELCCKLKKELPDIKILALSMSEEGGMISKMIEIAKVEGYIPKSIGHKELLFAIEKIASGKEYFAPSIIEQYESYKNLRTSNETINLTQRELQIIECMLKHYSNKQIAAALFISERTVETHRKNIYRKTNTKGEASLIRFVSDHKILPH